MNKRMKTKTLFTAAVAFATVCILAGCLTPKKPVKIDWAGRDLGKDKIPEWVDVFAEKRSVSALESMLEYKKMYCFVAENSGTNLKAVQAWANTIQVQQQIAAQISTRVGSTAEANVDADSGSKYQDTLKDIMTVSRDATYTGVVKNADYWIKWRKYDIDDKKKFDDEYTLYVLYTIEKGLLNEQIIAQLEVIKKNPANAQERAIVTGLIQAIRERGLGVEAKMPEPENSRNVNIKVFN